MEYLNKEKVDHWRGGNKDLIAAVLHKEVMADRLIFGKKFNVNPGEAAVWINNGKIEKIVTEGQVVASGVIDRMRSKVGAGQDMHLFMIDTTERILQFNMGVDTETLKKADKVNFKRQLEAYGKSRDGNFRYQGLIDDIDKPKDDKEANYKELINDIVKDKDDDFKNELLKAVEGNKEEEIISTSFWRIFHSKLKKAGTVNDYESLLQEYENKIKFEIENKKTVPILTKDRESISFQVRMVVSFLPEKGAEIYKLLKGSDFFSEHELASIVAMDLEGKVFAPEISKYTAAEIRGNLNILSSIHKIAEEELFNWLGLYGIQLSRISINPALTTEERSLLIDKEIDSLHKAQEKQYERDLFLKEKAHERELLKIKYTLLEEKARNENDLELAKFARITLLDDTANEMQVEEINAKITKIKKNAEIQAKRLEEELRLDGVEREWELDKEKLLTDLDVDLKRQNTEADIEIRKMQSLAEEHRKNKQLKTEARIAEMETKRITAQQEQGHVQKVLEIAANANALDSGALTEALRQETMRKALDQGQAAAQAYSDAEGQRYAKENFSQGLRSGPAIGVASDRGRVFVQQIPNGQTPGVQYIPGNQGGVRPVDQRQIGPADQKNEEPNGGPNIKICPQCNRQLPIESVFCGTCGEKF